MFWKYTDEEWLILCLSGKEHELNGISTYQSYSHPSSHQDCQQRWNVLKFLRSQSILSIIKLYTNYTWPIFSVLSICVYLSVCACMCIYICYVPAYHHVCCPDFLFWITSQYSKNSNIYLTLPLFSFSSHHLFGGNIPACVWSGNRDSFLQMLPIAIVHLPFAFIPWLIYVKAHPTCAPSHSQVKPVINLVSKPFFCA